MASAPLPSSAGKGRWIGPLVWGVLMLACASFVATHVRVSTSITHFLAPGADRQAAEISSRLANSELTRTIVLLVRTSPDGGEGGIASSRAAADVMAEQLGDGEAVTWVRTGVPETQRDAVFELYFPRRWHFVVPLSGTEGEVLEPEAFVAAETRPARLAAHAAALQADLAGPREQLAKRLGPRDPWMLFVRRTTALRAAAGSGLQSRHGGFVTADGAAVILLSTAASAFDADAQREVQAAIAEAREAAERALDQRVFVEQSGVGRFAIRAETAIRSDITRISALGTVAVVCLFVATFRSLRLMALSMLPLGAGVLAATAVATLVYGEVHGLTLAFGATLVGICVDYPAHLMSHAAAAALHRPRGAEPGVAEGARRAPADIPVPVQERALLEVRPGLILGAATTVVGFAGLGWTSFPGIREIASFAVVGIVASLATTLWVLPPLMVGAVTRAGAYERIWTLARRLVRGMDAQRRWLWLPAAGAAVVCIAGAPRIEFVDDPKVLTRIDTELLEEDERVRAAVSRMEAGQMVLASGTDDNAALAANERVYAALMAAQSRGELEAFSSLTPWLTSSSTQREVAQAWLARARGGLRIPFDEAFAEVGFRTQVFDPAFEAMVRASDDPAPLRYEDLEAAGLADMLGTFRISSDVSGRETGGAGPVTYLTYVRGISAPDAVASRLEAIEGVRFFDQGATIREAYAAHRRQGTQLLSVGLLAVLLVLVVRYRQAWLVLAAFAPSVLAAGTTLATLVLCGVELHLLHLVSSLLVLSMGVDYGVFLAESGIDDDARATTLVSLALACLSTVFAFGLLGLSSNPALRAVGMTSGLGVAWSLVLAPCLHGLGLGKGADR